MAAPGAVDVTESGSTPIACVPQTWTIGGTPTSVNTQAYVGVDSNATGASPQGWTIDANGLHVFPVLGDPNASGPIQVTAVAQGGNATLTSTVPVTSGKTGTLQHAIFASTQPTSWTLQTVNNAGAPTSVFTFLTNANDTYDYQAKMSNEISTVLSSSSDCVFQVVGTNLSQNAGQTATMNAAFMWAEN